MTLFSKQAIDTPTLVNSVGDMTVHEAIQDDYIQSDHTPLSKNKKMHIILVTETWFPDVNGVSMSLGKIIRCLAEDMGHNISLIRPTPRIKNASTTGNKTKYDVNEHEISSDKKYNKRQSFITHDIKLSGIPIPKYTELQLGLPAYRSIKKRLIEIKPDIVHIATEGPLGLSAILAAKRLKIPVSTGYHTQFHDFSKHFGLGVFAKPMMSYFRYLHNWSDATCVPSKKTKNDLDLLGFKRLHLVGRGVDTDNFNPNKRDEKLRKSWSAEHQHTVLIMVSRLSPEKGVDLVIECFEALQMQQLHRALKLVIVGDGPDRHRLESLSNNNDDIIFSGMQIGDELCRHYASGDAFIFASQVETFGNVVTEAMASGLPVYAFNDAAAGMLVDNSCGALATVGNTDEFKKIIVDLPKLQLLKKQAIVARKKVSSMSWQHPARQMLQMFENAIEQSAK